MKHKMKPIVLVVLAGFGALLLFSCEPEKNEDITQQINKNGSVETAVEIKHIDSLHDELITTHKVWVNNSAIKEILYRDTIPFLGKKEMTAENNSGDTKKVIVDKAYEIFITVK